MKRIEAQSIGELLQHFFDENPQLQQKIYEIRVQRAWGELLGPMISRSTSGLYVKNQVLHVSIQSSVLRSELLINRKRLLKSLNEYAGAQIIKDIQIR